MAVKRPPQTQDDVIDLVEVPTEGGEVVYAIEEERHAVAPRPAREVTVTGDQGVVLHDGDESDVLSSISPEGFAVDLNALRQAHVQKQSNQKSREVVVTPDYEVRLVEPGQQEVLAQVTPEGFAMFRRSRLDQEQYDMRNRLPRGTYRQDQGSLRGWMYMLDTSREGMGNQYWVWTHFSDSDGLYFTYLVNPSKEVFTARPAFSEHDWHVYRDGKLCLSYQIGNASLAEAFGRAMVWAIGIDFVLAGQPFPFELNQQLRNQ